MILEGTIIDGKIEIDAMPQVPNGTRVRVEFVPETAEPTHFELFCDVIGKGVDLPEDLADNHTHYAHGGPEC